MITFDHFLRGYGGDYLRNGRGRRVTYTTGPSVQWTAEMGLAPACPLAQLGAELAAQHRTHVDGGLERPGIGL